VVRKGNGTSSIHSVDISNECYAQLKVWPAKQLSFHGHITEAIPNYVLSGILSAGKASKKGLLRL